MKLYSDKRAPNPRRVRIFLAEKNITDVEVETLSIDAGDTQTESFLEMNPLGWLPVLELDDGRRIAESVAICRYFEELHPEPPLFGTDAFSKATVERWNRHMELELFVPSMLAFRMGHSYWQGKIPQAPAYTPIAVDHLFERYKWLDAELGEREWIAGDDYSIADITALAACDFAKLSKVRIGDEHPNLSRWYAAMAERPSTKA